MFTAYQLQRWRIIISSPVKSQPDGINVRENLLKISWHTHIKNSKPYTFILQKVKNPPDGFCTHILFVPSIILIFGGLFLHSIFRIIKVKLTWIRATKTDFERQKIITRRYNSKYFKPSRKERN